MNPETKWCMTCGRVITWRKKWAADWENIRYCSKRCRRNKPNPIDRALEDWMRQALQGRRPIDPTDAVTALPKPPDTIANLRERVRNAARRLVAAGEAEVVKNGRRVDPSTARGDFQLRAV